MRLLRRVRVIWLRRGVRGVSLRRVGQVREVNALELSLNEPLVFSPEQGQIVEAGLGWGRGGGGVHLQVGQGQLDQTLRLSQL